MGSDRRRENDSQSEVMAVAEEGSPPEIEGGEMTPGDDPGVSCGIGAETSKLDVAPEGDTDAFKEIEPALAPKLDVMPYVLVGFAAAAFVASYWWLVGLGFATVREAVAQYAKDNAGNELNAELASGLVGAVNGAGGWPLVVAIAGLLLAVVFQWWLRTNAEFKSQWWLGEVGRRVYAAYDIPWSIVSAATRFRPLPSSFWPRNPFATSKRRGLRTPFKVVYTLVVARGGGRKNVEFVITVPGDEGQSITLHKFDACTNKMVLVKRRRSSSVLRSPVVELPLISE